MVLQAAALLATLLTGTPPRAVAADSVGPLTVLHEVGGPIIVVREDRSTPLLSIRLSVPIEEPPELAGAGRVMQLLVGDRLEGETSRFGGRIELRRSPGHLIYLVTGPATAFDEMVEVLKYAVHPLPAISRDNLALWLTARRVALATHETPDQLLRHRLGLALLGRAGADDEAEPGPPVPGQLEWFWRRWFQPPSISVVVVGPVAVADIGAAFRGWPAPPAAGPPPSRSSSRERGNDSLYTADPDLHVPRLALGYRTAGVSPPALAVAAALIDRSLQRHLPGPITAEFWWGNGSTALAVLVAPAPGPSGSEDELKRDLESWIAEAAGASEEEITRTRRRLEHSLLLRARSTSGLASLLGDFMDRTGDPRGAAAFLAGLHDLDSEMVRVAIRTLTYEPPVVAEVGR